jgi:hypothetical protein
MDFNYYGIMGTPSRVDCPQNAAPITPPPEPNRNIPPDYYEALRSILAALPANPTQSEVLAALHAGLPAPPVNPETKLAGVAPQLDAAVDGGNVGVAARALVGPGNIECLFGSRQGTDILVWYPPHVLVQPGETSCDGASALARLATRPPH